MTKQNLIRIGIAFSAALGVGVIAKAIPHTNNYAFGLMVGTIILIGINNNRNIGLFLMLMGILSIGTEIVSWAAFPPQSILDAFLLKDTISMLSIARIAIGYALLLCGIMTILKGFICAKLEMKDRTL